MRLAIQNFLDAVSQLSNPQSHIDGLKDIGVYHKRHPKFPNLIQFSYDMVEADFSNPIARECRGIILDEADNWKIVCRGFDKFFNYGESLAAEIDWNQAVVQEKVDGSLIYLWDYKGRLYCSTTGMPAADGMVNDFGISFADYFWQTLRKYERGQTYSYNPQFTYLFELSGPMNRIVVEQPEAKLTFLGQRRNTPNGDVYIPYGVHWGVPSVKTYPLNTMSAVLDTFGDLSPLKQEGYVICSFKDERREATSGFPTYAVARVKVKHPGYVALHHAKFSASMKSLVEIARKGESSEVEVAFPELAAKLEDARGRIDALVEKMAAAYWFISQPAEQSQKEFALKAVEYSFSGALFAMRAKKTLSFRQYIADLPIDRCMEILGYK